MRRRLRWLALIVAVCGACTGPEPLPVCGVSTTTKPDGSQICYVPSDFIP